MSGRGAYYKAKYGGGGRGGGRGGRGSGGGGYYSDDAGGPRAQGPARSAEELKALLRRIDGAGYGAYRDMEGAYEFGPSGECVCHSLGEIGEGEGVCRRGYAVGPHRSTN
jgi:hypothetical protein